MSRYFVVLLIAIVACSGVIFALAEGAIGADAAMALCIGAVLLCIVSTEVITPAGDGLDIRLSRPRATYALMYGVYYSAALAAYAFRGDASQEYILEMSALVLLGYLGWHVGSWCAGEARGAFKLPTLGHRETGALLLFSWTAFGIAMLGYWYMASVGGFFTHGLKTSAPNASVTASLLGSLTIPFQGPAVAIAALLSIAGTKRGLSKFSAFVFLFVLCSTLTLSGQFRMVVTLLTLAVATLQIGGLRLTWRRVFLASCVSVVSLVLIQSARLVGAQRLVQSASPADALGLVMEGAQNLTSDSASVIGQHTAHRVSDQLAFLSLLIERVDHGQPYIYGKVVLDELSTMVIPRVFWTDKPVILSPQRQIRREFMLPDQDDSPGAVVAYYVFGGPVAVFCGLFVVGFGISKLRDWAGRTNGFFPLLLLVWIMSSVLFIEEDQPYALLTAIRHCLVAYLMFRTILFFYPKTRPQRIRVPVQGAFGTTSSI